MTSNGTTSLQWADEDPPVVLEMRGTPFVCPTLSLSPPLDDETPASPTHFRTPARNSGDWSTPTTWSHTQITDRPIPTRINFRTINFVQRWLTVWGNQLKGICTIGELEKFFYGTFVSWLKATLSASFLAWQKANARHTAKTNDVEMYTQLQKWALLEKDSGGRPWIKNPFWMAVEHTTWTKVLFVMSATSNVFPGGLLRITGHHINPAAKIEWIADIDPYSSLSFETRRS